MIIMDGTIIMVGTIIIMVHGIIMTTTGIMIKIMDGIIMDGIITGITIGIIIMYGIETIIMDGTMTKIITTGTMDGTTIMITKVTGIMTKMVDGNHVEAEMADGQTEVDVVTEITVPGITDMDKNGVMINMVGTKTGIMDGIMIYGGVMIMIMTIKDGITIIMDGTKDMMVKTGENQTVNHQLPELKIRI